MTRTYAELYYIIFYVLCVKIENNYCALSARTNVSRSHVRPTARTNERTLAAWIGVDLYTAAQPFWWPARCPRFFRAATRPTVSRAYAPQHNDLEFFLSFRHPANRTESSKHTHTHIHAHTEKDDYQKSDVLLQCVPISWRCVTHAQFESNVFAVPFREQCSGYLPEKPITTRGSAYSH